MQDDPQSEPNLSESIPRIQPRHGIIQSLLMLSLPQTTGDPRLRWLILDGRKLALSHGCGEIYSYDGITLAVQDLWKKHHRKLIVCVPEWMKTHEELDYHYLTELQDHLFIFYMPSEDKGPSFMDALAREMHALIVTQTGQDTWSEPRGRILQFNLVYDSFMLPEDPWGKKGLNLSSLLCSENPKEISVQTVVQDLMLKWERFSEILREALDLSFPEKRGNIEKLLIIDGSNVAMSHGLDTFFSCGGIYLAVLRLLKEGYCNITVFVPNWRYNSRNTVYGYKYLDLLYKKGFVTLTPSLCYEDGMMLKVAKEKNGLIVTNDLFKDLRKTWKDVINSRISYEFDRNHLILFPNGAQAVGGSNIQCFVEEGNTNMPNTGQTLHPDPRRPEDEDTT